MAVLLHAPGAPGPHTVTPMTLSRQGTKALLLTVIAATGCSDQRTLSTEPNAVPRNEGLPVATAVRKPLLSRLTSEPLDAVPGWAGIHSGSCSAAQSAAPIGDGLGEFDAPASISPVGEQAYSVAISWGGGGWGQGVDTHAFINSLRYTTPGRAFGGCTGSIQIGDNYSGRVEIGPVDPVYTTPVPESAPPGMDTDDYNKLNEHEKRMMWNYYDGEFRDAVMSGLDLQNAQRVAATKLALRLTKMKEIADAAAAFAHGLRDKDPDTDSPKDALRHAYWQCELLKQIGEGFAILWAYNHEREAVKTEPMSAAMDLFNNEVGRQIGRSGAPCGSAVKAAWDNDRLIVTPSAIRGPGGWNGPLPPAPPPVDDF